MVDGKIGVRPAFLHKSAESGRGCFTCCGTCLWLSWRHCSTHSKQGVLAALIGGEEQSKHFVIKSFKRVKV